MINVPSCSTIPDASALEAINGLAVQAHALTIAKLKGFGNRLTDSHKEALHRLAHELSLLTFGAKRGRYAYPLPTGMGKTQSVVAFCTALVTQGFDDKSVVVSATKVEALAGIKRDLIANGVPEDRIGLIHSYRHDPTMDPKGLPEGFASLPATDENDERQIMLVTHNRIKGGKVDRFNWYRGAPRNLVIWDESLLVSRSRLISSKSMEKSLGHLRPDLPANSPAVQYFDAALEAITHEQERQKAGAKPKQLELPVVDDNLLHAIRCDIGTAEVQEALHLFLEMAQEPLRVIEDKNGQVVVTYEIVVPKELESMAILDASYPIRELEKMDPTIKQGVIFPDDLKRFDHVRLHHLKSSSGRGSVAQSFKQPKRIDRKMSMEVCDLISGLPEKEGVIIFTFKTRGGSSNRKASPDFQQLLADDLRDAGVDTTAKLAEGDRIVMLTWGQETSLSEYSYCKHVVFAGVLHRDYLQIASEMIGQMDDLCGMVSPSMIRQVLTSEIAHGLYQAVSRGCCRIVDGYQALPMDIWLIHSNDYIRPSLEQMMPGVQWLQWKPKHLINRHKLQAAIRAIEAHLQALPITVDTTSTQALRKLLDLKISRNYFREALEMVVGSLEGWELVDRSVKRQEPDYAEIFKEAA